MARTRTKSDVIPIRLTLDAYAEAERRAEAKGVSVRQWIVDNLERGLGPLIEDQPDHP